MDVELLNSMPTARERLEDAIDEAGLVKAGYRTIQDSIERSLEQKGLWLPVSPSSENLGERWKTLLDLVSSTGSNQNIVIRRDNFFPPVANRALTKRWYLLPARRWSSQKEKMSSKEALEERLSGYALGQVSQVGDMFIGLDFQGISTSTDFKVTTPYNWLRAKAMYDAWKDVVDVRVHDGRDGQSYSHGILVVGSGLPSLTGEEAPHDITIKSVPIYRVDRGPTDLTRRISHDVTTSDDCTRKAFADYKFVRNMKPAFGRTERYRNENEIDHHTAAILMVAEDVVRRRDDGFAVYNPLPQAPDGVEPLADAALTRIIVESPNGNGRQREMLGNSVALMQLYTMMAVAYVNDKRISQEKTATAA